MTALRLLAAGLAALAAVACSSGERAASPTTEHTSRPVPATTTTVATTTTSTTAAAPTTTGAPGGPYATFTTPDAAAAQLIDAWRAGDRARASQAATSAAVAQMFAIPAPSSTPENRGCNAGLGGVATCFYRVGDNGVSLRLGDVGPTHWRVEQVTPM